MMRTSTLAELVAPLIAFGIVCVAAGADAPGLLILLAPLWFAPIAAGRYLPGALDERETGLRDGAERLALRSLLLLACAMPLLGGWAEEALTLVRREWADAGMLLVAVFMARGLSFASGALSASAAAQYAGGLAAAMSLVWASGLAVLRPELPMTYLVLAASSVLPNLVARMSRHVAGCLWLLGSAAVVAQAVGTGMVPIEVAVVVALFALPWATAGWWSLRARPA